MILAIDCSQRFCAAALYEAAGDEVRGSASLDIGRGHAERLPGLVEGLLSDAKAGFADISRIAVTVGPGSFAGIRVGVSFARGLALALGVPAVGVSTLGAMAEPEARRENLPVMAALDAKRGGIWCAIVDPAGAWIAPPAEVTPEDAASLVSESRCAIVGNAEDVLRASAPDLFARGAPAHRFAEAPDIVEIARIAARLDPASAPAEPIYLRAADAKPQAGFAVARAV